MFTASKSVHEVSMDIGGRAWGEYSHSAASDTYEPTYQPSLRSRVSGVRTVTSLVNLSRNSTDISPPFVRGDIPNPAAPDLSPWVSKSSAASKTLTYTTKNWHKPSQDRLDCHTRFILRTYGYGFQDKHRPSFCPSLLPRVFLPHPRRSGSETADLPANNAGD